MSQLSLQELESHLWKSADILRGSVDSSDYKNYIFGLLFLKRLSDVFEERRQELVTEHGEEIGHMLADDPDQYQFFVPVSARWGEVRKHADDIGSAINVAFEALENENRTLEGVLTPIDFNRKEVLTDSVLQRLLQHFSLLDLRNANLSEPDMLGRAYEYLIKMFADDAGKKGGEFYTPSKVVELIVKLIKPQEGMRVYDPTCGSGGMLIQSVDYVKEHNGNPKSLSLYGQEKNLGTWSIAKMNLLLHNLPDHTIVKGDTIREPKLVEDGEIMMFDRVIANPPFSLKEWGREEAENDPYGRFQYGIPPKNAGDYAFIQHMIASLKAEGKAGIVMPHGVLFRGGAEGNIRQGLLEADFLEAVVGLPSNLFYGTGIPACVLIFNRNKAAERAGTVLFIAAEDKYQEGKNQNTLRDEDIAKIVATFDAYVDVEKYARVVTLDEIKDNDYNLNITRYIDKSEEEEKVDIESVIVELSELEGKQAKIKAKLNGYLRELGLGEV
ncbi:type I restriction-modification system subunit M [Brevibacillus porteri]|uniref:site-specific DNA-methyltransferase (adenine-specific) n=1 Tax=Brevibacillus porteri TaxID=2126350 RepID=A0ABX5FV52_9BACL|nr:type I restriction-modification system subunit M [Brevibacillus porteri]MED1797382.1 type I restriction-modification system subunit M [Brevibacillus porteri]MED2129452.1 type I restriction-modification system subunit M [Brevibacillus porteri]MED2747625.1 type I restriction-modification system subunit M [Brevibacillus porteri]MED2815640.1 type I restriction-modification system subunit M [Brevibacillus porteri]MED2896753.1 type I restriction-modification system subunit M [Brevibacillus porter